MSSELVGETVELIPSSKRHDGGPARVVAFLKDEKVRKFVVRRLYGTRSFRVDRGEFLRFAADVEE